MEGSVPCRFQCWRSGIVQNDGTVEKNVSTESMDGFT